MRVFSKNSGFTRLYIVYCKVPNKLYKDYTETRISMSAAQRSNSKSENFSKEDNLEKKSKK